VNALIAAMCDALTALLRDRKADESLRALQPFLAAYLLLSDDDSNAAHAIRELDALVARTLESGRDIHPNSLESYLRIVLAELLIATHAENWDSGRSANPPGHVRTRVPPAISRRERGRPGSPAAM
jgi:hypothetical protein